MEAQIISPYSTVAPSPASFLRPKADVPECQANPGLQALPVSQKRQTGPQLPKPTAPLAGLVWGGVSTSPNSGELPRETLRGREAGVKVTIPDRSNGKPGLLPVP